MHAFTLGAITKKEIYACTSDQHKYCWRLVRASEQPYLTVMVVGNQMANKPSAHMKMNINLSSL
jgi:hypothetical protein